MSEPRDPVLHFGGPDRSPRLLREILRERIDAVPPGGRIVWATYYFRDRDLAARLMAASDRGVAVVLHVEGSPRLAGANVPVLAMLRAHGLGGGLAVHKPALGAIHPHLHSKIYCFSHPAPSVLVGSFNPSGDIPEDAGIVAEIGDQDRGHNLLVEMFDPAFVQGLSDHVMAMGQPFARLRNHGALVGAQATAWFYPRLRGLVAERVLPGAATIRGCVSHLKKGPLVSRLRETARKGGKVSLVVHETLRRVPDSTVTALRATGVEVRRFVDPDGLPMHAKFLLVDDSAWFGSFNFNPRSRWLNHEVLLHSRHVAIVRGLSDRFEEIAARAT